MIAIYTGWFLSQEISREEFRSGTVYKWMWRPWLFFMRWIAPVGIAAIILQKSGIINVDAYFNSN